MKGKEEKSDIENIIFNTKNELDQLDQSVQAIEESFFDISMEKSIRKFEKDFKQKYHLDNNVILHYSIPVKEINHITINNIRDNINSTDKVDDNHYLVFNKQQKFEINLLKYLLLNNWNESYQMIYKDNNNKLIICNNDVRYIEMFFRQDTSIKCQHEENEFELVFIDKDSRKNKILFNNKLQMFKDDKVIYQNEIEDNKIDENDVIGIGYNYKTGEFIFTFNGELIVSTFFLINDVYEITMNITKLSKNDYFIVNLGTTPFVYDIHEFMNDSSNASNEIGIHIACYNDKTLLQDGKLIMKYNTNSCIESIENRVISYVMKQIYGFKSNLDDTVLESTMNFSSFKEMKIITDNNFKFIDVKENSLIKDFLKDHKELNVDVFF